MSYQYKDPPLELRQQFNEYRRMSERVSEKTDQFTHACDWSSVALIGWSHRRREVSWPILSKTVFLELLVVANLVTRSHSFYSMFFLVVFAVQTRERAGQERVCMTNFRFGFVLKQHLNLRPTFFGQVRLGVWLHLDPFFSQSYVILLYYTIFLFLLTDY